MDPQIHHIKKHVIEIRLKDNNKINETREKINGIYNSEVLKVLNEVFDEYFTADSIVMFDKLELNLGRITEHDMEKDLPAKIKEKISELLHLRMNMLPSAGKIQMVTPEGKIIKSAASDNTGLFRKQVLSREDFLLNVVLYYLKTGAIPWYAAGEIENMESALLSLILKVPEKTAKMLLKNLSPENARERMAKQFSAGIILKIAGLYNPECNHLIRTWIKTVNRISEKYAANKDEITFINYILRLTVIDLIGNKLIRRVNDEILLQNFLKMLMNKAANPRAVIRHMYFAVVALGKEVSSLPVAGLLGRRMNYILSRKGNGIDL